ncbi:hypothetical protein EIK77_006003 [Talaromyces pinophilus]|nr:hypothetical protein EIK77_006003 [Talaromyces pinophilus]
MKHPGRDQIERILDRVHSLDDLSADDIIELRHLSEQSIVINRFKIFPAQYYDWLDRIGDNICGVEYDAQHACVILKGGPSWMHEAAADVIHCPLAGKFRGSSKQADASLKKSKAEWPVVVLEVGISETTTKLYEDAERWLEGSDSDTKLVILVDIQETRNWKTSNDKWGLSEADFRQLSHRALSRYIFQWYRSRGIQLVGSFKLSVYLWYSDGDRQCILNDAAFSPGKLIDLTTIQDIPLRLDYLMPSGSDFDLSQPLLFPLRHLVHTLQNGFEDIEIQRASKLAKEEHKKYPRS